MQNKIFSLKFNLQQLEGTSIFHWSHANQVNKESIMSTFIRVSGTRGPSQIRTDLTNPADGLIGSIRICYLWTQDICKLRIQPKHQYVMDPGPPPGPLGPMGPSSCISNLQIYLVHRLQILMDPLGLLAGSMRSVRIWLGSWVPDTPFIRLPQLTKQITYTSTANYNMSLTNQKMVITFLCKR